MRGTIAMDKQGESHGTIAALHYLGNLSSHAAISRREHISDCEHSVTSSDYSHILT
jgi:hypothetical protein